MKALLKNNIVQQIANEEFPVSQSLTWVDIPEGQKAEYGYLWDGSTFTPPSIPEPPPPTSLEILQGQVSDLLAFAKGEINQIEIQSKYKEPLEIKVKG